MRSAAAAATRMKGGNLWLLRTAGDYAVRALSLSLSLSSSLLLSLRPCAYIHQPTTTPYATIANSGYEGERDIRKEGHEEEAAANRHYFSSSGATVLYPWHWRGE